MDETIQETAASFTHETGTFNGILSIPVTQYIKHFKQKWMEAVKILILWSDSEQKLQSAQTLFSGLFTTPIPKVETNTM